MWYPTNGESITGNWGRFSMTSLLLIRHGQTAWNREEIFRGRIDVPLDETGWKQAQLLGERLREWPLRAVYSSPLSRARETAEAVAAPHGLPVQIAAELTDLDFGEWQGKPHEQVQREYPDLYLQWQQAPHRVKMPGGESLAQVRARALSAVERLAAQGDGLLAVVSHRVVLKVLFCALLGLDNAHFWRVRLDTGGMSMFSLAEPGWVLDFANDLAHLQPLGVPQKKVDF